MRRVITIDGPAGTGKTTLAMALADALGWVYLDSGALYRTIALGLAWAGVTGGADPRLAAVLKDLPIQARAGRRAFLVFLGQTEVGAEIRTQALGQEASRLAAIPAVRARVATLLREAAAARDCVAEGRDMGSAVFPEAHVKIFLTANLETRARRRSRQLHASGTAADETEVRREVEERDARDRSREVSPLREPAGAVVIDNSALTPRRQLAVVRDLARGNGRRRGTRFYRLCRGAARGALWLLRARVRGTERIPPGACLVACNHRSNLDPPIVGGLFPGGLAYLAKAELFRFAPCGWLLHQVSAIPVRRGRYDRRALEAARRRLAEALPVLVFPEGTRARGRPLSARGGVGLLARESGVPVVPAYLSGSDRLGDVLRGKARLELAFGEPLRFPESGDATPESFAARVMAAVHALGGQEAGEPLEGSGLKSETPVV